MTSLSPRQREILGLVAAGRTSKEIASELGISERTVNWHISGAFGRLGASSRAEAVAIAMRDDANGDDDDDRSKADGPGRVGASDVDAPERVARAWPAARAPLRSLAPAFALTLLLGMLGGALIAGWGLSSVMPRGPVPSPTHMPSPTASSSASPRAGVPGTTSVESAPPAPVVEPTSTAAPPPRVTVLTESLPVPSTALPAIPLAAGSPLPSLTPPTLPALPALAPIRTVP